MNVAILFAAMPSIYDQLPDCDVYNMARDARTFPGGMPVIAHPPCAQWGVMRGLARRNLQEKSLALWAVDQVRRHGGVLEHPLSSTLWWHARLPPPGERDEYGGWSLALNQHWFGHRARKATYLYIVGCEPNQVPPIPMSLDEPPRVISSRKRVRDGGRTDTTTAERSATPLEFASWLLTLARHTHPKGATP